MSQGDDLLRSGFDELIAVHGDQLVVDEATRMWCIAEDADETDSQFLLGSDGRELVRLYVTRGATILTTNQVVSLASTGQRLKIVRRFDSPADFTTRYYATKIIGGKDR